MRAKILPSKGEIGNRLTQSVGARIKRENFPKVIQQIQQDNAKMYK